MKNLDRTLDEARDALIEALKRHGKNVKRNRDDFDAIGDTGHLLVESLWNYTRAEEAVTGDLPFQLENPSPEEIRSLVEDRRNTAMNEVKDSREATSVGLVVELWFVPSSEKTDLPEELLKMVDSDTWKGMTASIPGRQSFQHARVLFAEVPGDDQPDEA